MAKITLTKAQQRLAQYNDIIANNKNLFKVGSTMDRKQFVKLFNIQNIKHTGSYQEIHRSNLKLVAVQQDVNKLMRENGLYFKSGDYYSHFSVAKKEPTKNTIIRYSSEVDINKNCTERLYAKMDQRVKAGTWGKYNKLNSQAISHIGNYKPTARHVNTINRVKII